MWSYRRNECETNDLERWENEGGRLCQPGSENVFHGRDPKDWRMKNDRLPRSIPHSIVPRDDRMPLPALRKL